MRSSFKGQQCSNKLLRYLYVRSVLWFVFYVFTELQMKLELTLKEKNQVVNDLETVREQLKETRDEVSLRTFWCMAQVCCGRETFVWGEAMCWWCQSLFGILACDGHCSGEAQHSAVHLVLGLNMLFFDIISVVWGLVKWVHTCLHEPFAKQIFNHLKICIVFSTPSEHHGCIYFQAYSC